MLSKSKVKYIQTLFHKKFRDQENRFIIEGAKIINEFLLKSPETIYELYATGEWAKKNSKLIDNIPQTALTIISEDDLKKISALPSPNQALAIVQKKATSFPGITPGENIVMLDEIQDPGNMGTIIRIADWFGITKIICSTNCADIYNPKVIQSTMGSILRVHILYTDLLEWCKQHKNLPVYAATLHGKSIYETAHFENGIILMGNESKGIKPELLALSKIQITIPRIGEAESLNAAVATGIILSHFVQKTTAGATFGGVKI
ncbi:MAG: RNA methyltransferase [Agriterribacter sp.]